MVMMSVDYRTDWSCRSQRFAARLALGQPAARGKAYQRCHPVQAPLDRIVVIAYRRNQ